ncbi:MAG TPA: LamG domain-containing protein, partial [Verrucomicrobiae bacterium]
MKPHPSSSCRRVTAFGQNVGGGFWLSCRAARRLGMFALRLKRIAVAAGLLCALGTGTARAGLQVVGCPASQWGVGDAALGLAGYTIEDFEDAALVPNLLVGCESPAGNLTPTSTLPNVFNPTNDAYGTAFRAGVWDGSRCLVNTRDNQSHSYAESQHWGTMILEFPTPVRSVGFSVQQLDQDVRLFINGTELGGLAALSGLPVNGQRQGYVRIDATGTNTIAAIRLTSAGSYDGWVIDHLAFSTNPPPFQLTGFAPNFWATNDWALGVAGWFIEDFEDTNLAPHLLIGCETAAGNRAVTDTLPNLFNPTNDTYGTAFRGAPWTGSNGVLNTRDNQSHAYSTTAEWGDIFLQFTVPLRAVAFSVQQMETDARLWINGVDYGGLLRLAGLTVGTGRQGYVRIDATGTNAITSIKIDNAPGDGFVLDHLACLPVVMPAPPGLFAWWTGDDTAEDCVGFFHGQLRNGASFAPGKVGKAFRLDGVDDFVEMPNVVKSNGAFSFAFWMKADAFTHDRYMGPFCQENGSTVRSEYKGWFYYTGNSSSFHSLGMQGTWTDETTLDGRVVQALQPGVWYHVVTTYDGVKLRQYLNGALRNEASYAGKALGNPWPLRVGKLTAFPTSGHVTAYFHGLLDEIMFFNRSLSADEVAAVYAADSAGVARPGILPPAGLAAWWPGDGNADDVVGWNDGWLVGGAGFTNGLVDRAFAFDGADDRLMVPHDESLNIFTNGFTVEFWMRGDKNQPGAIVCLVEKSHGWVDSTGWVINGYTATGRLGFAVGAGGAGIQNFVGVAALVDLLDGRFHHLAGGWDRSNVWLYVDGQLQGTTPLTAPFNNTRPLNMGCTWGNGVPRDFFRGTIDEVCVYQRALTAEEIAAIAASGSVGRQKPACVAPPADLVAWLPGEGNADDFASGLNGTTGGNVAFVEGRVGRAFRFVDSPNSYVTLPNSPTWLPANNQLTIAAWVKPDFTVTGDKADTILSKRDGCGTFSYHFGVMKGHRGMTGPLYFGMSGGV